MFELRLVQGGLLKKLIDAIKDLLTDANFDCSSSGFSLQAMDSSHVALVSLLLRSEGFEHFRCDRAISMGMNIANMAKMLKCASQDDIITVKADDGTDTVTFMFESPSQDKISDIEMKLMDIDSDHLGIPEVDYDAIVRMPASEFSGICSSLSTIGDTVTISVSKQGVTFSTKGDIGAGNITCRQSTSSEKPEEHVIIEMKEPIVLTFALKYITLFTKATSLCNQVTISLCNDMPMVVEYKIAEMGYIRFYLAPKIEEEDLEANPQAETRARAETRAENEPTPEPTPKTEEEQGMTLSVMETKEENGGENENVPDSQPVKMETESEADLKPKVEMKSEFEAIEHKFKMEAKSEADDAKPKVEAKNSNGKAEVKVMDVE